MANDTKVKEMNDVCELLPTFGKSLLLMAKIVDCTRKMIRTREDSPDMAILLTEAEALLEELDSLKVTSP